MGILKYIRKKRELKEIDRLNNLLSEEKNDTISKDIMLQIHLCKSMLWGDYNLYCRKY